jgi:hypothetical protein
MEFELLVPIALFVCITLIFKFIGASSSSAPGLGMLGFHALANQVQGQSSSCSGWPE